MGRIAFTFALLSLTSCVTAPPPPPAPRPIPAIAVRQPVERLDMDLVRRVDEAIQGRFAVVREEDVKAGRLGANRVGRPTPVRHSRVFEPEADSEREMLTRLYAAGWRGVVYVVNDSRTIGPIALGSEQPSRVGNRNVINSVSARCRETGAAVQDDDGAVALEARPVVASEASCLRCHSNRQVGETIGVVVYAFKKERAWVATSGQ